MIKISAKVLRDILQDPGENPEVRVAIIQAINNDVTTHNQQILADLADQINTLTIRLKQVADNVAKLKTQVNAKEIR